MCRKKNDSALEDEKCIVKLKVSRPIFRDGTPPTENQIYIKLDYWSVPAQSWWVICDCGGFEGRSKVGLLTYLLTSYLLIYLLLTY